MRNTFESQGALAVGGARYEIFRLAAAAGGDGAALDRLPFSLRVLLENLLRNEDGRMVTRAHVEALLRWDPKRKSEQEIAFFPARVLLQDFTGVPCVVDLAAMREAFAKMGGDIRRINPLEPVDLVIDHSVQVDRFASTGAFAFNTKLEVERNRERYQLLRWGQRALDNFRVVPPGSGICHQVNLEYLASVVIRKDAGGGTVRAYPDTLVGTDSHTTMINALGVLGWGVGGIEAEAAMLGQPQSLLIPEVVGFKLEGALSPGSTATDLVLTVTQMLRKKGVVGRFVEFFGPGLASLSLPDRATIANMAPEYGATCGFFPVDDETLAYLRFTGRAAEAVDLVEAYCKEQRLFRTQATPAPEFMDTLALDLGTVEPSLAGPKRPQDRVPLRDAKRTFRHSLVAMLEREAKSLNQETVGRWLSEGGSPVGSGGGGAACAVETDRALGKLVHEVPVRRDSLSYQLGHGAVVIAAITSCTNTSNPAVMLAAGLLAKKAVERGLDTKPWVKTSLAPGSKVVIDYLREAGLVPYLEALGFHLVGYGCTTCIGNSGPLPQHIDDAVQAGDLVVASVLSGNRNFEGRINSSVRMNFLASPPLVVAYALAGEMDVDLVREPIGHDRNGDPVYLKEIWPSLDEVRDAVRTAVKPEQFREQYGRIFEGDDAWKAIAVPEGRTFGWEPASTYVRLPTFLEDVPRDPPALTDIRGARCLALLGDSVTTDHISPAGEIPEDGPAAKYLVEHGVKPCDFNSFGARRGNHEVMIRGTFGNIRLKNALVPGVEGGYTAHVPSGDKMDIYDAAVRYRGEGVPLIVLAGAEYGTGSSRDWAAKGTLLLGVRAVIAKSFERIHRSNLIGMGVLPLEFKAGEDAASLGLKGRESFEIAGIADGLATGKRLTVKTDAGKTFDVTARLDTPNELDYYRHGGILQYVLRSLLKS